jgi:uncharacterized protein (UPF0335 family)
MRAEMELQDVAHSGEHESEGPAGVAVGPLRSFIERVERLEEEKKALTADIRELYNEAKAQGFDSKVMRQVVRLRRMDRHDRLEQEALLDLYLGALGMTRGL